MAVDIANMNRKKFRVQSESSGRGGVKIGVKRFIVHRRSSSAAESHAKAGEVVIRKNLEKKGHVS